MSQFVFQIRDPSFPTPLTKTDDEQQHADTQQDAHRNSNVESTKKIKYIFHQLKKRNK